MSWFARDSSPQQATSIDTSANHCDYSGRRLCTAAEVCPSSPGGQSVAGVTGGSLTKALLVVGDTFVDAATCQRLSQIYQAIPLMVFYVALPVTCQVLKTLSVTVSDVCVEIILLHRTLLFCM